MGRKKINKNRAQLLKKHRDSQRLRYMKIRNDPVLWEKQKLKEREKYKKKREKMKRKLKAEMTHRELENQKKCWRKWNDTRREKRLEVNLYKNSPQSSQDDLLNFPSAATDVPIPIPEPLADELTVLNSPQLACDDAKPHPYRVPVHGPTPGSSKENVPVCSNSNSPAKRNKKRPYSELLSTNGKWMKRIQRIKKEHEQTIDNTDQQQPVSNKRLPDTRARASAYRLKTANDKRAYDLEPVCRCQFGCRELTNADKLTVFENFDAQSYNEQSHFLARECVKITDIKRRRMDEALSRRQCTALYYVPLVDRTVRVCRQTLCSVLQVSPKRIQTLQKKMKLGESLEDKRGTHRNRPNKYQLVVKQDDLDDLIEVKYEIDDNHALYPYVQLDADESSLPPEQHEDSTVTLYAAEPQDPVSSTSKPPRKRRRRDDPDDEVPIVPADIGKCRTPDVFVDNPMADDGEDEARALGDFVSAEMRRIRSDERRKSLRKTIEEAVKAMVEEDEKEFFQDPATDPLS